MKPKRCPVFLAAVAAALALGHVGNAQANTLPTAVFSRLGLDPAQIARLQSAHTANSDSYGWEVLSTSCARRDDCEAVAAAVRLIPPAIADDLLLGPTYRMYSFAEHWDGVRWTQQQMVNPAPMTVLDSISCYAPKRCVAVGAYSSNLSESVSAHPLAEIWNGVSWRRITVARPKVTVYTSPHTSSAISFASVSCTRPGRCVAVGELEEAAGYQGVYGIGERFNGTRWSSIAAPQNVIFQSVSCPAANECFAIPDGDTSLAYHWVGGRWIGQRLSLPSGFSTLTVGSLACISTVDCYATGFYDLGTHAGPVIEHYDGRHWLRMALPQPAYQSYVANYRSELSCSAAAYCVNLDSGIDIGKFGLVLHNGRWQLRPGIAISQNAISCPAYRYCVAVTQTPWLTSPSPVTAQPLASIFNGQHWRTTKVPLASFSFTE